MKRLLIGVAIVLGVAVIAWFLARDQIALALMERQVTANFAADRIGELPDGLHVVLCGAGGPMPDPKRSGPCVAVIAGKKLFVFDAGSGGARNMARMQLPIGRTEALFLTHFHSDHIDGLGEFMLQRWINDANTEPLPVYGPEGVDSVVVSFNKAYALDSGYRTAHHGETVAPASGSGGRAQTIPTPAIGSERIVYRSGGVEIRAFLVPHDPATPALGYRIDYGGRAAVISGDTAKSAEIERMARGADLLVHEALAPQLLGILRDGAAAAGRSIIAKIANDILDYHATPVEAAETAEAAGVPFLLYYHITPPLPAEALEAAFLEGVSAAYSGRVAVGRDGTMISLPAGSSTIDVDERL